MNRSVFVGRLAIVVASIQLSGTSPVRVATPATLAVGAQRAATFRDSLTALRSAKNALQVYLVRYAAQDTFSNTRLASTVKCEKVVFPYCFGPSNGGVPFGAPLLARSVEFRTSPDVVRPTLARRYKSYLDELLRRLDAAQKVTPGDRWIVGQRVFYMVEHGELERALRTARTCKSERWWCALLVGYASYLLDQHAIADSAFGDALASLPLDLRCSWDDLADLVYDDPSRRWYEGLTCAQKQDVGRALWWLADPLFLTPGNERRSAHYYREVFKMLMQDSFESLPPDQKVRRAAPAPPMHGSEALFHRGSSRELWQQAIVFPLIRGLGVPAFWVKIQGARNGEPTLLLQFEQPTYHFIPKLSAVQAPMNASSSDWLPHDTLAIERYHPHFGQFLSLNHQVAYFKRDDAARLVAAADVESGELRAGERQLVTSAIVLSRTPGDFRFYRDTVAGTHMVFDVRVPAESSIVSIETLVQGAGAARARFASGPPLMPKQRVTQSDVLFVKAGSDSLPTTLDAASHRALPGTTISAGEGVVLFWELYGMTAGDSVYYSASVSELGTTILARAARLVGIGGDPRQSSVEWAEHLAAASEIEGRSVKLLLSTLRSGRYTLTLATEVKGQERVVVTRNLVIR